MTRNGTLLLFAAVAVGCAAVWILTSSAVFGTKPTRSGDGAGRADEDSEGPAPSDDLETGATLGGTDRREEGKGSVRVRVLFGGDHGGVRGAGVTLSGKSARKALVSRMATTDDAGAAAIDDVPAGDAYLVRVSPPGEPVVERPGVSVRAGEATVLGEVFVASRGEIEGRVLDEERKPVEGAQVVATLDAATLAGSASGRSAPRAGEDDPWPAADTVPGAIAVAATDKDGAFRLDRLPSGVVALRAVAAGYRAAVDRALVPGAAPWKSDPATFALRKARAIAGVVVDRAGKGIAGANVDLGVPRGPGDVVAIASIETGEDGGFRVDGFGPSDVSVRFRLSARGLPTILQDMNVLRNATDVLRFVLAAGATVRLVVTDTFEKRAVAGATAVVGMRDAKGRVAFSTIATTDRSGGAEFPVEPGSIDFVLFRHPRYRSADVLLRLVPALLRQVPITWEGDVSSPVAAGETRRVALHPWRGFSLYGRATDPRGGAIPGLSLRVSYGDGTPSLPARLEPSGDYHVDGVVAEHMPYVDASASGWALPATRRTFDLGEAGSGSIRKDVMLFAAATVRGKVVDAKGRGVAAARVVLRDVWTRTNPDGSYVLGQVDGNPDGVPSPPARLATVSALADGWLPGTSKPFPMRSGDAVDAPDVVLSRGDAEGEAIVGRVVGPDGAPIPLALVETVDLRSPVRRSTVSGADGRFALRALPTGEYQLRASAPGFAGISPRDLQLSGGALALSVEIRAGAWVTISGRVLKADGTPIPRASVRAESELSSQATWLGVPDSIADADESGAYTLRALTTGDLWLVAGAPGFAPKRQQARAKGVNDFTLMPGGR